MSDFLDRTLNGSAFGVSDEERKRLLSKIQSGTRSPFSITSEERREKLKDFEAVRFRRLLNINLPPVETESISNLAEQLIKSFETVKESTENLNVTNAGLNMFLFHCLSFVMGEIITNSAQATKAKQIIEQSINQNFPDESRIKTAAFGFCGQFFEKYSTGEDLSEAITASGEH